MSEKNNIEDKKIFDDLREDIKKEFDSESIFFKRKMSQFAFWTVIDKDLANQYYRDEKWLFGIKYKDELKLIDHGTEELTSGKISVGFVKKQ